MATMLARIEARPGWLDKIVRAKQAAYAALTPQERAQAEADREARRDRAFARRAASRALAKAICGLFFDGRSDAEIAEAVGRKPRAVRRFAEMRGFTITRSRTSVRRLVALSSDHETHLRELAERNGMTAAGALDLIVSVALSDDGLIARCILRNEEAVRGAVKHAFVTATYPPAAKPPEEIHVRD